MKNVLKTLIFLCAQSCRLQKTSQTMTVFVFVFQVIWLVEKNFRKNLWIRFRDPRMNFFIEISRKTARFRTVPLPKIFQNYFLVPCVHCVPPPNFCVLTTIFRRERACRKMYKRQTVSYLKKETENTTGCRSYSCRMLCLFAELKRFFFFSGVDAQKQRTETFFKKRKHSSGSIDPMKDETYQFKTGFFYSWAKHLRKPLIPLVEQTLLQCWNFFDRLRYSYIRTKLIVSEFNILCERR